MTTPDERRRHPRYQIQLPARMTPAGRDPVSCQVRDYCNGGMLVQLPARAAGAVAGVGDVSLSIGLRTQAGLRDVAIPAVVAWVRNGYVGLAFAKPSPVIVEAVKTHQRLSRAAAPVSGQGDPGSEGRCLARMRHVGQGTVPAIIRELLERTLETLLEDVDRVSSDTERHQVYSDLTTLEGLSKRDLLLREVMARALNPGHDRAEADEPHDELSLVDTDEFERWLEASRVATQLERHFGVQLSAIGARLSALRQRGADTVTAVPFEPKNFTDALKSVAGQLELGARSRGVLFDRAASVLHSRLGAFYGELDAALDAAGAPPPHRQRGAAISATADDGGPATAARPAEEGTGPPTDLAPAADEGHAPVPAPTDVAAVAVDPQALAALAAQDREQRERQARELLDQLASDSASHPGMNEWLQMLDGSVIDHAVADPAFFQAGDTPLHAIVDALGHLQLFRPAPETKAEPDALRRRIDALLAPLSHGDADAALIGDIAKRMDELAQQESDSYRRNVERVVEASEGRERVRRARRSVGAELDRRYAGRRVPALVPELIEVGWRSVLELAWLNAATRPEDFDRHLATLDSVVGYLGGEPFDPASPQVDRQRLLAQVGAELETTAVDPFRRNAVEMRLRAELLGGAGDGAGQVEMPALSVDDGVAAQQRPSQIPAGAWDQALATCASIRLGDRVHFVTATGEERALRVAWIREDRELFTLVDHRGTRVRDIALAGLAAGIHERDIRLDPVDGRPLSGRAVDQMLDAMEARLAHLAAHDSLTGLMNRRQFHSALEMALGTPDAHPAAGALLWIDIDQFKLINDIHGYATGDRLLVALAALLQRLGGDKVLGHLGADRFAVLAPGMGLAAAARWAGGLCAEARRMPFDWNGRATALTVSIGALELPRGAVDPGDAVQAAERALSVAKAAGGDQVHVYRDDDPDIVRERDSVKWVARVDEALVDGELHLRCQPIVPVRPGEGVTPHYEVLLGVADGSREALPIAEFIEAAERYKRMRAVDRWVTRSVFDWVAAHRDMMPQLHGFAVNLSGQTASDPAFVDFVRDQFTRTSIDPAWISFEITETAAVASLTGAAGIIHDLKRLGCKVALDDFGSGLASYSYLRELPVDWLKIDGVFVRDIATDREDYAVVKSINEIAHFLGKKTIAEYVKDRPTLELVRGLGVDLAQGYGISPPLLMADLLSAPAAQATG